MRVCHRALSATSVSKCCTSKSDAVLMSTPAGLHRMIPSNALGRDLIARFDDYATKYQTVRMERRDGILQMTVHTGGAPRQWGLLPPGEFPQAFRDVGSDPDNKVVIITGTGDTYSGPRATGGTGMRSTPAQWDRVYWEGKHLLMSLLDIEV